MLNRIAKIASATIIRVILVTTLEVVLMPTAAELLPQVMPFMQPTVATITPNTRLLPTPVAH